MKSSDTYPKETPRIISLNVRENWLSYCIEFFEKAKDIRIRGSGWTPSGKGVLIPCYEISDSEIKREMIDFLLRNKEILLNRKNSIKLYQFAARHKEELKQIGNHDLFQGLVNSGAFNWIKEGGEP